MKKKVLSLLLALSLAVGVLSMTANAAGESQAYQVGYAKVDINPYWHEWTSWSVATTNAVPDEMRGVIPYEDFYDEYDIMPMPMAGYGGNEKRLSRPKLVDDNGSGVGASSTNVTNSSYYYMTSSGSYSKASNTGHYVALYKRSGNFITGYKYTKINDYQDVHLSSNRYTKELAAEMGVTYSDGVYGENDGDGVWATCVLVKDPQSSSPVLMITVDNIGVTDGLVVLIKESIVKASAIKALGLTEDRILITSNHTHGSVSLGTSYSSTDTTTTYTLAEGKIPDEKSYTFTAQQMHWYLNFYKNLLINQLTKAAVTAAGDLETALTMEKGTIDASDATGYQLNGVRHSVQTYTPSDGSKPAVTYVRGSSFNNDMNQDGNSDTHAGSSVFSKSQPVSESDDSLHILQFTFANKKPIAMVNFRAHSTANNKQAALLLHYNISSDWVAPLRYEMEQAGYRFSLLYGSSGNLGTGNSNGDGEAIVSSYANYNSSTKRWELPATPHGRQVAAAALKLLENDNTNNAIKLPMTSVNMGKIESLRSNYVLKKQEWSPLAYAAALSYYNAGSPTYGGRYTIADGETVTYGSASITLGAGQGGTFVIASKYHASNIKSQYTATYSIALELNALVMGESVAFATTSVEASDRYSNKEITGDENIIGSDGNSNYNENDWDNLINEDAWGTPFVLSLTNASNGYIPNQLAYDYGKDYTGTDYIVARGSYESNNTYANRGEGEKMVASLNTLLRSAARGVESTRTAYCEYCKAEKTWKMFDKGDISSSDSTIATGHYFLASDFDHAGYTKIVSGQTVCLDLNGHAFSAKAYATSSRACNLSGRLNVQDTSEEQTGKIQGCGVKWTTSTGFGAGTIMVSSGAELNLYSGSITMLHWEGYGPYNGGVLSVTGTFNMYGGKVYGGIANNGLTDATNCNGGNILVSSSASVVNMYGGEICDGEAYNNGGNIYMSAGKVNLLGGTITGGKAAEGAGIYAAGGTLTINGTDILGGKATGNGGSLHVTGGTVKLQKGRVGGGTAVNGGGVYLAKAITMTSGTIIGGTAKNGGALYVASGVSQALNAVNLQGGKADNGGTLFMTSGATVTTTKTTTITGGEATNGGCVYLDGGTLTLVSGAMIADGTAENGGCLYVPEGLSWSLPAGVTLSGGNATNGGNVYVAGTFTFPSTATIETGSATNGGNIYLASGSLSIPRSATLSGGRADNGGNLYLAGGSLSLVSGSYILDGEATNGGNLYVAGGSYTLPSGASVTGGNATKGGNVYLADGSLTLVNGLAIGQGLATDGGIAYVAGGNLILNSNMTLSGGEAYSNGGNVYLAGGNLTMASTAALSGGSATNGGNLYVGETAYTMTDGTISGGTATGHGGNIYLENAQLTMTGGTISDGTATGSGGNIYVPANAEFVLNGGSLTGGTATGGGSVYVAAQGAMQVASGSISGGTVPSNGGNVYIASKATLTMTGGQISGGRAEKSGATTMGGNIYCGGTFTMDGGTITGGYAHFGGNIQAQGANAFFTMRGGRIENGSAGYKAEVADLCTGQSGSENGYSQFRMEGGFIAGWAYIQGKATLTGTTDGDVPMNISVKVADERLTIEGKYTGKINLTFNGNTYNTGDKIGNAIDADLSEATIILAGVKGRKLAVEGDELRLVVSGVAKIGDMGYETVDEAMEAYTDPKAPVVLLTNLDLGKLTKDLYLDLNGFAVTAATTNGYKLYCLDSATDDYTVADGIYGTVPSSVGALAADGYLAITEDSKTSFHKYEMTVTHLVVNTKKVGLTYKSSFRGDEKVKEQVKEFGVAVQVLSAPVENDILQDTELRSHAALQQEAWQVGNTENDLKSVYIVNILREGETAERNNVRADIQVYGVCYMQLLDGTVLLGKAESQSLKSAMQYMNSEDIWNNYLTDEDKTGLASFYNTWSEVMQSWTDIDRIKETAASV